LTLLIDTNVISEVRKGERCNASVAAWYASITDAELFLSVLVLGEIRKGIEQVRGREPRKAAALEQWLLSIAEAFGERILPIDRSIAEEWGRMATQRSIPVIDGLLAATAKINGLTLVTRNAADVAGLGALVLNPFVPPRTPD
jgi:hypothetical protein